MNIPMAKKRAEKQTGVPTNVALPHLLVRSISEGGFILALTAALFILLSLWTYQVTDPGWSHASLKSSEVVNAGGRVGAYIADAFYLVFGYCAYFLPICFVYLAWVVSRDYRVFHQLRVVHKPVLLFRSVGLVLCLSGCCGFLSLHMDSAPVTGILYSGGFWGELIAKGFCRALNVQGASLLLAAMVLVGVTWLTALSWVRVTEWIGQLTLFMIRDAFKLVVVTYRFLYALIRLLSAQFSHYQNNKVIQHVEREWTRPAIKKEKNTPKLTVSALPVAVPVEPILHTNPPPKAPPLKRATTDTPLPDSPGNRWAGIRIKN